MTNETRKNVDQRLFDRLYAAQVEHDAAIEAARLAHDNEVRAARVEYFAELHFRMTVLEQGLPGLVAERAIGAAVEVLQSQQHESETSSQQPEVLP